MEKKDRLRRTALNTTRWLGSVASIGIHTLLFSSAFLFAYLGYIPFSDMLLILTTIVSLEAIYLAIFIQMTVNYTTQSIEEVSEDIEEMQEDVEEIQEDIDEIQEDVDELQEDVEEFTEDESEDEKRKTEQKKTLAQIQTDLSKLMEDIAKLQSKQ